MFKFKYGFSYKFLISRQDRKIGCILPGCGILELSGEAGCGKTQICLILSLQVLYVLIVVVLLFYMLLIMTLQAQLSPLLGGLDGSVAYISCGEGQFPIRRLSQLAKYYQEKYNIKNQDLLSGIHIEECPNLDDFMAILVPS